MTATAATSRPLAWVTGGATGIGFETARLLADKGYRGDTNVPNCHVVNDAVEAEVVQRLVDGSLTGVVYDAQAASLVASQT